MTAIEAHEAPDDEVRTQHWSESQPRLTRFALRVGTAYLVGLVVLGTIKKHPTVQAMARSIDIGHAGWLAMLVTFDVALITSLVTALLLWRMSARGEAVEIFGPFRWSLITLFLLACVVSFAMVAFGVWPWEWTRPGATSPAIAVWLMRSKQLEALAIYGLMGTVAIPLLEEFIFRFGVLRWMLHRWKSESAAIFASSALFGLAHVGTLNAIDEWSIRRMIAVTCFALVAATLTVNDRGRIRRAVVIHAARNGLEFFFLCYGAYTHM